MQEKDKRILSYQIFIVKVSEIIGFNETVELLAESKESANNIKVTDY